MLVLYIKAQRPDFLLLPPLPRSFREGLEAPVMPHTPADTQGAEPV